MLGDWESFCFEVAHDPALQKAVEPDREAVAVEDEWTRFREGIELRAAGIEPIEMHQPRLRSERNTEPDGIAKSSDRKKAAARSYLQRRMASGESAAAVIASVAEKSASTAALLREVAHEN